MDYNTATVYSLIGAVAITGFFLWPVDWILTLACIAFAASHLLVFNIGRLIEAHNRENRGPIRMVNREHPVNERRIEQRPQSLASRIASHNERNQGWGEVVKQRSDSILNY